MRITYIAQRTRQCCEMLSMLEMPKSGSLLRACWRWACPRCGVPRLSGDVLLSSACSHPDWRPL